MRAVEQRQGLLAQIRHDLQAVAHEADHGADREEDHKRPELARADALEPVPKEGGGEKRQCSDLIGARPYGCQNGGSVDHTSGTRSDVGGWCDSVRCGGKWAVAVAAAGAAAAGGGGGSGVGDVVAGATCSSCGCCSAPVSESEAATGMATEGTGEPAADPLIGSAIRTEAGRSGTGRQRKMKPV